VLLDLDPFKRVNDSLGHPLGDERLRAAARALASAVRDTDRLFRIGGDECLVLLRGPALDTAHGGAQRMTDELSVLFVDWP
jgi:diguanylate cyclase (GGDEF)-like protein